MTVADVKTALEKRGAPAAWPETVPKPELPGMGWRPAAVLCVLFDEDGQANVVLTRRSDRLRHHTGEVSFPGGRIDAGEAPEAAALREAHEEIGLEPSSVEIIGELSSLVTVSNPAPIAPFIATVSSRPKLSPNPTEVERVFTVELLELMRDDVYREELWVFPDGVERPIHFFELEGDTVWGATARMLKELLDLIAFIRPSTER